ncbi:MAG: hypothetical protein IKW74_07265, partial [Thermoguttaceae bacterium]|nr:hypothetical protein [Thermoguttaceae bacterium]
ASAPENNITVPDTTAVFSLAEFGKMIGHFLPDAEEGTEDDLVSQLKPYIDILKDASPDAKILVTNTLKDTELTGNIRMTGEHVAAIGKLIQAYLANQMAGLDEDADENIDDSFE